MDKVGQEAAVAGVPRDLDSSRGRMGRRAEQRMGVMLVSEQPSKKGI